MRLQQITKPSRRIALSIPMLCILCPTANAYVVPQFVKRLPIPTANEYTSSNPFVDPGVAPVVGGFAILDEDDNGPYIDVIDDAGVLIKRSTVPNGPDNVTNQIPLSPMALLPDSTLCVAVLHQIPSTNTSYYKLRIVSRDGVYIREWPVPVAPSCIIVGPDNTIYVAGNTTGPGVPKASFVYQYSMDGTQLNVLAIDKPTLPLTDWDLRDVAVDVNSRIYVTYAAKTLAAQGESWIWRYTGITGVRDKEYHRTLGNAQWFAGIAVDRAGRVWVGDQHQFVPGGGLLCFDSDLVLLGESGGAANPGNIGNVDGWSIKCDDGCALYVTSSAFHSDSDPIGERSILVLSQDLDNDGLCDSWEEDGLQVQGETSSRLALGTPTNHKDIFLEIDHMDQLSLLAQTISSVQDTLAHAANSLFASPNPDGQDGITVHWASASEQNSIGSSDPWLTLDFEPFRVAKRANFGAGGLSDGWYNARNLVYHYGILARAGQHTGLGFGEEDGNDFVMRLTSLSHPFDANYAGTWEEQAGVLMHELGHNLGLDEGGGDGINYKPNYRSVMNWAWTVPQPSQHGEFRPSYSWRGYLLTLNEQFLNEGNGIGPYGKHGWHVIFGPPVNSLDECKLFFQSETGYIDWNGNGHRDVDPYQRNINIGIKNIETCEPTTSSEPELLRPYNDWSLMRLGGHNSPGWRNDGDNVHQGPQGIEDLAADEIIAFRQATLDCDANGVDDATEIAQGAPDIDCNGVPDKCDGPRITCSAQAVTMCPGADAGLIQGTVLLDGVCGLDLNSNLDVAIVRDAASTGGVVVFDGNGRITSTTLTHAQYDPVSQSASFVIDRVAGCGTLVLDAVVGSVHINDKVAVDVRSVDVDGRELGGVDRFDLEAWTSAFINGGDVECYDFDRSGVVDGADESILLSHRGHSIPRRVTQPNGGDVWTTGGGGFVEWLHGYGIAGNDSSKVEITAVGAPGGSWRRNLKHAYQDYGGVGIVFWAGLDSCLSCKIEVKHTAGTLGASEVGVVVGSDMSDAPFTVLDGIPPGPIQNFQIEMISSSSVTLSWSAPGDDQMYGQAKQYDIRYATVPITSNNWEICTPASGVPAPSMVGTQEAITISNLQHCVRYYFAIKAKDEAGQEVMSGVVNAKTLCSGGGGMGEALHRSGDRAGMTASHRVECGDGCDSHDRALVVESRMDSETVRLRVYWHIIASDSGTAAPLSLRWERPDADGVWRALSTHVPPVKPTIAALATDAAPDSRIIVGGGYIPVQLASLIEIARGDTTGYFALRAASNATGAVSSDSLQGALEGLGVDDTLSVVYTPAEGAVGSQRWWLLAALPGLLGVSGGNAAKPVTEQEIAATPMAFALLAPRPNPARDELEVSCDIARRSTVRIQVIDLQGRVVARVFEGELEAGRHSLMWRMSGVDGRPLKPGVVFLRMMVPGEGPMIRRVVIAH